MSIVQNPHNAIHHGGISQDVALLMLRVMAGGSMILYNSWLMVQQGWEHLWRKGEWILLNVVADLGVPSPVISACLIASIYFFASIFLMLGVFGRLTSAVLLVTTEIGFYLALQHGALAYVELSLLYSTLYLLHLFLGSGRFSLDQLLSVLARKRVRRRNPGDF